MKLARTARYAEFFEDVHKTEYQALLNPDDGTRKKPALKTSYDRTTNVLWYYKYGIASLRRFSGRVDL